MACVCFLCYSVVIVRRAVTLFGDLFLGCFHTAAAIFANIYNVFTMHEPSALLPLIYAVIYNNNVVAVPCLENLRNEISYDKGNGCLKMGLRLMYTKISRQNYA